MPPFIIFPKELLLNTKEDEEPITVPLHNQEPERDKAKIESVHIESDDDGMDTTQATTPAPQSKGPMSTQERAIHQLIDELAKSDTDTDEEEVPIN
ncbi:hypothetical protein PVK06_047165 [Gossypium arboreum]|uniref:Uncharacterized protein n=1 Tax=Gossypium arboreum TaxID=29729 RepID=A0ABR0MCJ5_GOSAR|nr:hypothetical protein PVK06_047165 [Gossypium arboreum]